MGKNTKKKSKVTDDRSTDNAVLQLVYDFLKRGDGTGEIAELLKKKTKLVMFLSPYTARCFPGSFVKKIL